MANEKLRFGARATARRSGVRAMFGKLVADQLQMATTLYNDKRCRAPILIIWVASLGGALHAPVTTYYLLEVGAKEMDVGWLGFIAACGSLFCGPVYGWLLDNKGPFVAMTLAAFMCSAGCLLRGMAVDINMLYFGTATLGLGAANLWTTVLAYLASVTDASQRSRVVSAYMFQVTTLSIVGKALFPIVDWLLLHVVGITDNLLRMRVHMGECTLFCFFGFAKLVSAGQSGAIVASPNSTAAPSVASEKLLAPGGGGDGSNFGGGGGTGGGGGGGGMDGMPTDSNGIGNGVGASIGAGAGSSGRSSSSSGGGAKTSLFGFGLLATVLMLQAFSSAVGNVLWPLYLKDKYQWTQNEYAYVLFAASIVSTVLVALTPSLEQALGRVNAQFLAASTAAAAAGCAFQFQESAMVAMAVHIGLMVVFLGMVSFMEPGLKAMASNAMPAETTGLAFGVLNSLSGLGTMAGNPTATWLYQASKDSAAGFPLGHGAMPMVLVASVLGVAAMLLLYARKLGVAAVKVRSTPPVSPDLPQKHFHAAAGIGSGSNSSSTDGTSGTSTNSNA